MSFRISVAIKRKSTNQKLDDLQLLGNNENYLPLQDEFERQGIDVRGRECYGGQITELQPIIDILEKYIWEKEAHVSTLVNPDGTPKSIFNLYPKEYEKKDLTLYLRDIHECGYIFVTVNLIKFLEKNGAIDMKYSRDNERLVYFLKDDFELWVDAG